jgi:hypothetical protein
MPQMSANRLAIAERTPAEVAQRHGILPVLKSLFDTQRILTDPLLQRIIEIFPLEQFIPVDNNVGVRIKIKPKG